MTNSRPKARQCRREGVNLFGTPKMQKILNNKPGVPGMHGGKRAGKMSEYARQLREKQKMKRMYGLSEKQFRNLFDKASRAPGVTGEVLFQLLERRLDNGVFRSGMALTRAQSRQFCSHGILMVNGTRVDVPSIQLKVGDVIEIRDKKKSSVVFTQIREALEDYKAPDWLKVDLKKGTFEVISLPDQRHFDGLIEPRLIVEFYSR